MLLKPPRNGNVVAYHARNARASMPLGARRYKPVKAGRWKLAKPRRACAVVFDLAGPCEGSTSEVLKLAIKLAKEAIQRGDREYARAILARVQQLNNEGG